MPGKPRAVYDLLFAHLTILLIIINILNIISHRSWLQISLRIGYTDICKRDLLPGIPLWD